MDITGGFLLCFDICQGLISSRYDILLRNQKCANLKELVRLVAR